MQHLTLSVRLGLLVGAALLIASGCQQGNSKVTSALAEVESDLDKSSDAVQQASVGKPSEEDLAQLEEQAQRLGELYQQQLRMLERLNQLKDERFTPEEKARFQRALDRLQERRTLLKNQKDKISEAIERKKQAKG